MIYLETNSHDPCFNLAFEEYAFSHFDSSQDYFMLWQNDNAIIVGKYQNTYREVNIPYVEQNGIKVVRRLSGGGAVYHDLGNLNFTFIVNAKNHESFDFKFLIRPLIDVLKNLGITAEFNGRNDITIKGRKVSGNSQFISDGRLLHHGTLMLTSNLKAVENALNVSPQKMESKGIKSVRSRVTTINQHLANPVTMEEFKTAIKEKIFEQTVMERWSPSENDLAAILKLRNEKYATWEWNFGESSKFTVEKHGSFSGGRITVQMSVKNGIVQQIRFYGDFFGNGNITELEAALQDAPLNEGLLSRLNSLPVTSWINGLSAPELFEIIYR